MNSSVKHMAPSRCSGCNYHYYSSSGSGCDSVWHSNCFISYVCPRGDWLFINIARLLMSLSLIIINNHKNGDTQTASQERSAAVSWQLPEHTGPVANACGDPTDLEKYASRMKLLPHMSGDVLSSQPPSPVLLWGTRTLGRKASP